MNSMGWINDSKTFIKGCFMQKCAFSISVCKGLSQFLVVNSRPHPNRFFMFFYAKIVYSKIFVNVYAVQEMTIFWDNVLVRTHKKWQKFVSKMLMLTKIFSWFVFHFVYWLVDPLSSLCNCRNSGSGAQHQPGGIKMLGPPISNNL